MKTMLKLAAALVLLVMIGGVVTLQSAIKDARGEQQELSKAGADAGAQSAGKDGSGRVGESDEVLRLREANKDLPKLRNEVRQLRRQADEMAKLQADNERLQNAPKGAKQYPPDYIRRAALADAGLATPEATVQTFLWAMLHGDIKRLKDCVTPEAQAHMSELNQSEEQIQEQTAEMKKVFPGFRIAERKDISASEVELKVEIMPGMDGANSVITVKRVGSEWKMQAGGF